VRGISVGSFTTTTQTVNADIIAQKSLSFCNSSGNGAPLVLNGNITGDGVALRGIHFICGAPILVSQRCSARLAKWSSGRDAAHPAEQLRVCRRTAIDTPRSSRGGSAMAASPAASAPLRPM